MDELQTARTLLAQTCGVLKVFPLPGAVVLPGTPAPFHVFESRYRAMTADALAGDRMIAVATLVSEEGAVQDRAPVHPIAGAGIIEVDERRPDGRYDLVVRGVARVRLAAELANGKPYRESGASQLATIAARTASASALADLVAAAVVSEPERRLAVLEALDVGERLEIVTGEVASVVLMLSRRKPSA